MPVNKITFDDKSIVIEDHSEEAIIASLEAAGYNSAVYGFPIVYIIAAIKDSYRPFNGKAHVTDAIGCLRQSVLKEKTLFALDLDKHLPLFIGSAIHKIFELEGHTSIKLSNDVLTGELDVLENLSTGSVRIWDFKFVKSYAMKLALGIVDIDVPIIENGLPVLNKSGKNAGKPKTKKEYRTDFSQADIEKYADQLNSYRYLYSLLPDSKPVEGMYIFMGIKDASTTRGNYGITKNAVHFQVPRYNDEVFVPELNRRAAAICTSMMSDDLLDPGEPTAKEVWDGRLCNEHCPVKDSCVKHFGCRFAE